MRQPRTEMQLKRPATSIALMVAIFIAGISAFSCGGCRPDDSSQQSAQLDIPADDQALEITTYPREGDVLRDLGRPIVVEFSNRVQPEAFSYRLSPDSDGWSATWAPGHRRVVLKHLTPLLPDQSYELEVTVKPSAEVVTTFSTQGPSSLELIARDEASGIIDLDTAWAYRMQYVFEEEALPDAYRSTTPVQDVDSVFRDFLRVRSELEPETLYRLRPYTVRPDHPDSVFSRYLEQPEVAHSGAAPGGWVRAAYAEEPDPAEDDDEDTPRPARMVPEVCSPHVVVWSAPEERMTAQQACGIIQSPPMYEKFEKLLGRRPIDDTDPCPSQGADPRESEQCVEAKGGDGRLDIYLVPQGYFVEGLGKWAGVCIAEKEMYDNKSTAFILVKLYPEKLELFASTIAHEMFHAFQFAFDVYEDSWWMEATATWSEEYFNPKWNTERRVEDAFDSTFHSQVRLNHEDGEHEYGIYLFPYYLEKIRPGSEQAIADIWKACEDQASLKAIDNVLDDGLDETLKDFAVVNLDLDPYKDRYGAWLGLFWHHGALELDLEIDEEMDFELSEALDYLSARYHIWTNKLNPDLTPLVRFHLDDFAGNDKLFLHAIIRSDNGVQEEDWSDRNERVFCINQEDGNFNQIFLVLVSAERPSEPGDGSDGQGTENQLGLTIPKIKVSVETEACRPTMGTGEFTIEIDNNWEDSTGTSSFTERVSAQVIFDEFHPGSAEYKGRARVRYKEHHESHYQEVYGSHVEWTKDTSKDVEGSGEVECSLFYAWGSEDTTYSFACGSIEVHGKTHSIFRRTLPPEVKESNVEFSENADLDAGSIGSYHGGLPARYDLVLTGTDLDEDISPGINKRHFSSWNFSLNRPSPP
jgi:hypothetical protein